MRNPPTSRLRCILKWAAMIWCIVLLVAWGLSPWTRAVYTWIDLVLTLEGGHVVATRIIAVPGTEPEFVTTVAREHGKIRSHFPGPSAGEGFWGWIDLWFPGKIEIYRKFDFGKAAFHRVDLPFWLLFIASLLPTAILWWHRRIPPGHCQACGYNLTGNVSGICPECGMRIEQEVEET